MGEEIVFPFSYVKPEKYSHHIKHGFELYIKLDKRTQTVCLKYLNSGIINRLFLLPGIHKSKKEGKINIVAPPEIGNKFFKDNMEVKLMDDTPKRSNKMLIHF